MDGTDCLASTEVYRPEQPLLKRSLVVSVHSCSFVLAVPVKRQHAFLGFQKIVLWDEM